MSDNVTYYRSTVEGHDVIIKTDVNMIKIIS